MAGNIVITCQHCHKTSEYKLSPIQRAVQLAKSGRNVFSSSVSGWKNSAATPNVSSATYRQEPARAASVPGDVAVPFLQSLCKGLAVSAVGYAFLPFVNWVIGPALGLPWYTPLLPAAVFYAWDQFHGVDFHRELLWKTEEITGLDIDRDSQVGAPPSVHRIEATLTRPGAYGPIVETGIFSIKVTEGFRAFAHAVAFGSDSFSERTAARHGLDRESEWEPLRDEFISKHWAYWKDLSNRNLGVGLRDSGIAVLRRAALQPPSPTGD